jgi:O-antigen ligase
VATRVLASPVVDVGSREVRIADGARIPTVLVGLAVSMFPLLRPHGPGHVTPCDVAIALAILGVLVWVGAQRIPMQTPYVAPMAILIVTGLLAAQLSVDPDSGYLAIGQDVFLFLWAACVATLCRTGRTLSSVMTAWVWAAAFWASLVIGANVTHQWWLTGGHDSRAQLWFDNPNMAGNYFLVSLFVLFLARRPQGVPLRLMLGLLMLGGLVLTGSNAALVSLGLGGAATVLTTIWRRSDIVVAFAVSALVAAIIAAGVVYAIRHDVATTIGDTSNELISRSVARGPKSAAGRSTLFAEEFRLYRTGGLLGRGPASTQANIDLAYGPIVKEAHDDYLATLVERGPIGVIGLLILLGGIGVRAFSVAMQPLRREFDEVVAVQAATVGILVAILVTATTHEILHYRHLWAVLGILAALYRYGRRDAWPERGDAR